jgi:hypothetical protein
MNNGLPKTITFIWGKNNMAKRSNCLIETAARLG